MSYRTFKRILGETSLERKCRFLFGGALMVLITGSFYYYAQRNQAILERQNRERAELLIGHNLFTTHAGEHLGGVSSMPSVKELSSELKPQDLREDYWKFIAADNEIPERRPGPLFEHEARDQLLNLENPPYVVHEEPEAGQWHFLQRIVAQKSCLQCHQEPGIPPEVQRAGDVMGIASVSFDLAEMKAETAKNNAILVVMAMVTTCLAMFVAYVIVRYVIVKPVMHLKEVSDAIAHGDLDQRADIRTGDEFQELSHAYNRMLRHLVTTQDELRHVNADLDAKVDELARANLSLHEMNKIKNEFLATMSHELRTPLNSILGFSDVLSEVPNLNDKQRKYVTNIRNSGQSLLTLINDILDLAKIEAGRMEIHAVDFSMGDLIERLTSTMKPLAEKKNIQIRHEVAPDLPIIVQDLGKLQQIFLNLLSNAIKFTPEGGRITISAAPHDEVMFDLVVADSGIGIPLEDQAVIFEKFRQGRLARESDALTREYEGTGLGLSIVKELSKLLGGEVTLESEFGKGSTFTVRLPMELACPTRFAEDARPISPATDLLRQAASYGVSGQRDAG